MCGSHIYVYIQLYIYIERERDDVNLAFVCVTADVAGVFAAEGGAPVPYVKSAGLSVESYTIV